MPIKGVGQFGPPGLPIAGRKPRIKTGLSRKQAREFNSGVAMDEIPERVRRPSAREMRMTKTNGYLK